MLELLVDQKAVVPVTYLDATNVIFRISASCRILGTVAVGRQSKYCQATRVNFFGGDKCL